MHTCPPRALHTLAHETETVYKAHERARTRVRVPSGLPWHPHADRPFELAHMRTRKEALPQLGNPPEAPASMPSLPHFGQAPAPQASRRCSL